MPSLEYRLDAKTMFDVRTWERFQFVIDSEHEQVKQETIAEENKCSVCCVKLDTCGHRGKAC